MNAKKKEEDARTHGVGADMGSRMRKTRTGKGKRSRG